MHAGDRCPIKACKTGILFKDPAPGRERRLRCSVCPGIAWERKPTTPKSRRPAKQRNMRNHLGVDWCQDCGKRQEDLPPGGRLECHHKIRYTDGGSAEPENGEMLCTRCHNLRSAPGYEHADSF